LHGEIDTSFVALTPRDDDGWALDREAVSANSAPHCVALFFALRSGLRRAGSAEQCDELWIMKSSIHDIIHRLEDLCHIRFPYAQALCVLRVLCGSTIHISFA